MTDRDTSRTDFAQRTAFRAMGLREVGDGRWIGTYDPRLEEWRSVDGVLHLRVVVNDYSVGVLEWKTT